MSLLNDVPFLGWLSSALSVPLAVIMTLEDARWGRGLARRRVERSLRLELVASCYQLRPVVELYALVPKLALQRRVKGRRQRYELRATVVQGLPPEARAHASSLGRRWLDTVGRLAAEAARGRLPLRPFFATYHLGVIREGAVAVPICLSLLASGELGAEERENLFWGMAMMDLAARYNSVARQQRAAVYFRAIGHQPPVGPVRRAPRRIWYPLLDLVDMLSPRFRLRSHRYQYCRFWLGTLAFRLGGSAVARARDEASENQSQ